MSAAGSVKSVSRESESQQHAPYPSFSSAWTRYIRGVISREVSRSSRFSDSVWVVRDAHGEDPSGLFAGTKCYWLPDAAAIPDSSGDAEGAYAIILNGSLNNVDDIHGLLAGVRGKIGRRSRVLCIVFNSYLKPLYSFLALCGLRKAPQPKTFITFGDLDSLSRATGFEVVRSRPSGFFPWRLLGLGDLINKVLPAIPLLRWCALATVVTLRPVRSPPPQAALSLSVVVPVRNEKGNLPAAFEGLSKLKAAGLPLEAIFVEGHSHDGSWEALTELQERYSSALAISLIKQDGLGKADAVRKGFANAKGDLLAILDADLTVAPESLTRFYEAYSSGLGDFINGSRLVYPMERGAMAPLNFVGNLVFSKMLSALLGVKLSDTLCGTKLFARRDYLRMERWREGFGNFDPFGDFEMLFPAAVLGMGIVNVPVHYRARTYGSSNILRFRHGAQLLGMCWKGLFKVTMADTKPIAEENEGRLPDRERS